MQQIYILAIDLIVLITFYEVVVESLDKYGLQNHFHILGYVTNDELVSLYKNAKALVFPSFFGPTNIPPLEALALGCNVIISNVYAHYEQLGEDAIYFSPNNANELADLLTSFMHRHIKKSSPNVSKANKYVHSEILSKILVETIADDFQDE